MSRRFQSVVPGVHLSDQVAEALSTEIRSERLAAGDKLPTEAALVEQFGVSRTVVREAISQLQASGLTQTRHGIGTFVVEALPRGNFQLSGVDLATLEDVISVLELRIGLETEAAALAARRRTPAHVAAPLVAPTLIFVGKAPPVNNCWRFAAVHTVAAVPERWVGVTACPTKLPA